MNREPQRFFPILVRCTKSIIHITITDKLILMLIVLISSENNSNTIYDNTGT